ncbi:single-stranded DNA-binding protein [Pseudomonas songnenensis]|uniref:Single-stranded DNA-binding protein n=1 Tax=Pseudomonas songnenensis TaxID=1176259 RepID=A0ABX9UQK6_9PSED|nr:single-stranded DNA-binding protein [Pseudomonas songnenensis]MCQ4302252.1 single-stranded DNA-binding protein [Pseudomonas songnenensis]RMH95401.1 single-stranded DNA-binding protein [Pseudomonas songnenensis]
MNVFSFTGNLGKDCRVGTGQTAMVSFGVGVKSGWGDKAQTIWIDCTLWGKQAESRLSEFLVKGQQVAVSGELGTREHEGKTYLTCRVNTIDLVGGKREEASQEQAARQPAPRQQSSQSAPPEDEFIDDIPFADPYRGARSLLI